MFQKKSASSSVIKRSIAGKKRFVTKKKMDGDVERGIFGDKFQKSLRPDDSDETLRPPSAYEETVGDNASSVMDASSIKGADRDEVVYDMLMNTIDELRSENDSLHRQSEATINELRQQRAVLQEKLDAKTSAELAGIKAENMKLKFSLQEKIAELKLLQGSLADSQHKQVQTSGIFECVPAKETQFMGSLSEFSWIEKLLMENIADCEAICSNTNANDKRKKWIDSKQKS